MIKKIYNLKPKLKFLKLINFWIYELIKYLYKLKLL